ncbi:MAG: hypothetical protein AAFV43_05615 [Planctomycetota bacterium]
MNFLGKCFVVALFVMSCAFMGAAIAAYGAHRDLKAEKQRIQTQLNQTQAQLQTKTSEFQRTNSSLTQEKQAATERLIQLESEKARLAERNRDAQAELDALRTASGAAIAGMEATQISNNALADELNELRDSIREALSDKDRYFATALEATEKFQAIRNDIESALEQNRELVADTSRMTSLLRANNLDPNTPADAITPKVDGVVSRTKRENGAQLVEISIGSDDGIRAGDTVDVFRNTKYRGRLEILRTAPDRAVGRVDVRFQQGPIQEGDRVTTRLKLS